MKKLYYLINHEYRQIGKPVFLLLMGDFVLSLILVLRVTWPYDGDSRSLYLRYEQVLDQAGVPLLCLITILALALTVAWTFNSQFQTPRSIYTLFQLPVPALTIFCAKWISLLLAILQAVAVQALAVRLSYLWLYLPAAGPTALFNGFFLAWARSDFLNLLLPGRWTILISNTVGILLLSAAALGLVLDMRRSSRKVLSAAIAVALLGALAWVLARIGLSLGQEPSVLAWIGRLLAQFILLALIIWRSVRRLERRTLI